MPDTLKYPYQTRAVSVDKVTCLSRDIYLLQLAILRSQFRNALQIHLTVCMTTL